jgi:hypothetical protein
MVQQMVFLFICFENLVIQNSNKNEQVDLLANDIIFADFQAQYLPMFASVSLSSF